MATLDEIRLQQLLAPFNQTGVMSSSQAVPMINSIPMINTGMIDQRLQNTDLVNQIIERNRIANMNKFANTVAPLGNTQQIPLLDNTQQIPLQNLGIDTSYGVANEDDQEQVDSLTGEKKSGGIADLFRALIGFAVPGASFFLNKGRGAMDGIKSLNQRLRNTDFAKSSSLADYFDARSYGGRDARDRAASKNMREARAIQRQVDMRPSANQTNQDRGRGNRPGGANYSAPSRPSRSSGFSSSARGRALHG